MGAPVTDTEKLESTSPYAGSRYKPSSKDPANSPHTGLEALGFKNPANSPTMPHGRLPPSHIIGKKE